MSEPLQRPPVEDWTTDFDHYAPEYIADPYPINDDMREQCPVAHTERYGGVSVPLTYDLVAEAAHRTDDFTSRRIIISETSTDRRGVVLTPINLDPPHHTAPRRVMLPFFNPRKVRDWEPAMRAICQERLDAIADQETCDLAADYARHVPGDVTAAMFGVDPSEGERFRAWIHDLMEVGPTNPAVEARATSEMMGYMVDLVAERKANGSPVGDDLVTFLLDQDIDGEPIPDDDMAKMLFLLLIAGIDTTWSALGHVFLHLATHPEDRRRLAAEPELIPTATEEFLRAFAPVQVGRIATTDTEIGGCPVSEGDWVMLNFPAACRDPEMFEDPDEVIIDRAKNRHAAFGLGVHRCLGSNLARVEMHIAIEMLLERIPEFTLVEGHVPSYSGGAVRGPRDVPVVLG
ncbi:MAG: cytochrome P450 [Actinomycetota bacterium]